MKTLALVVLLFARLIACGQDNSREGTREYLNDKYGFRDAVFESSLASLPGMKYVRTVKDGVRIYTRATDKLAIGEFPIRTIEYGFYKSKLYSVHLVAVGANSIEGITEAFTALYGPPEVEYDGLYRTWASTRVLLKATVIGQKADFTMSSGYVYNQITADAVDARVKQLDKREKAGQKAAADL